MSITALTWALLYSLAIVFSLFNPLSAALGYLLEYYMRPDLRWWGDELPTLRYNLIMSVVLGLTFLLRRGSLRALASVRNLALPWLLSLGAIMLLVTSTAAIDVSTSWSWMVQWAKMAIIFPLLLVGVIRTRSSFNAIVLANMLGSFWWGWNAWLDPKRAQSRLLNVGSGDSLDDNGAAAHLLTVLPFCIIYLLTEKDWRLRAVGLVATPFVINTIILCNSRGATLGMLAASVAALFLVRSGYRLRIALSGLAVGAALFLLADQQFITRQKTTADYQEDGSAQQRLASWKGAIALVKDRPMGTGGRGFHLLSPIYIPEVVEAHDGDLRAPHNTYAMVASEWGVLGLISYLGVFASTLFTTRRIRKRATVSEGGFYYWRAFAIELSLVGFLVAGAFVDRLYAEAGYWLVALAYALYRLQSTEQAEEAPSTRTSEQATGEFHALPARLPA